LIPSYYALSIFLMEPAPTTSLGDSFPNALEPYGTFSPPFLNTVRIVPWRLILRTIKKRLSFPHFILIPLATSPPPHNLPFRPILLIILLHSCFLFSLCFPDPLVRSPFYGFPRIILIPLTFPQYCSWTPFAISTFPHPQTWMYNFFSC